MHSDKTAGHRAARNVLVFLTQKFARDGQLEHPAEAGLVLAFDPAPLRVTALSTDAPDLLEPHVRRAFVQ